MTEDCEIKFHENTLEDIKSYEEAAEMSSDNTREHYLNLPHYVSTDVPVGPKISSKTFTFIKPAEDILPESVAVQEKFGLIDRIKQSNCEHCVVTKFNGYKWIYICNSLKISPKNGVNILEGQSPLGIELPCLLDEIEDIAPLKELFSDVHWESPSSMSLKDYDILREILFDAIANGKPIWIAYNSNNSGYGTRFLSNIAYSWHITHDFCTSYRFRTLYKIRYEFTIPFPCILF